MLLLKVVGLDCNLVAHSTLVVEVLVSLTKWEKNMAVCKGFYKCSHITFKCYALY